ncbi:hypothetical protein KAR91_80925 [Candidatus Pacearchaeota archaeon]|nr:hypothetical protein [Candidatus Pacearchaeota archaeon]
MGWLTSCSITQPTTTFVIKEEMQQVLDSVATAQDSIRQSIVVYNVNVIPPEPIPPGMSQENIRLIIAEAAGTISTLIAIMFVGQSTGN